jgi:selenocysteine-specific elongation factor
MIVGVAGHIDHGKTALVRALTGVDADRLAEEKARGISIDLGFAYLPRPDGGVMGFVDMPGHERFMRNMLAGASGIDLLLLVVAADDGVMPQTREHLAVAALLGIGRAIVAISKCDAADARRIAEVEEQVTALLSDTRFAAGPRLQVSAHDGRSVDLLLHQLDHAAAALGRRREGPARFAVDRSFSLAGAGTVVTGVVVQGAITVGDILTVSPAGREARVRSLHVQNRPGEIAHSGERCGVSLGGRVRTDQIGRGDWLLSPALHAPTDRIDAHLHLLASEERVLRHWTQVRLHHGASEVAARLALLQDEPLQPGESGMVQLVLEEPIAAAINDRFVLRAGNGLRTIGGGRLIDLRPPSRRRKQERRLAQLAAMAVEETGASLEAQLASWPSYVDRSIFLRDRALDRLPECADVRSTGDYLFQAGLAQRLADQVLEAVAAFHERHPRLLGPGLRRLGEALDPRLPDGPLAALLDALVREGRLARDGGVWRRPAHRLGLDRSDEELWGRARPLLDGSARFRPPLLAEMAKTLAVREFDLRRVLALKVREGELAEIAEGRYLLRGVMADIASMLEGIAAQGDEGMIAAADLRDRLANGRKVSIQILEYFDRQQVTARRGDLRVLDRGRLARYLEPAKA